MSESQPDFENFNRAVASIGVSTADATKAFKALDTATVDATKAFKALGAAMATLEAEGELEQLGAYTDAVLRQISLRAKWGVFAYLFPDYRKAKQVLSEYENERA